MDHRFTEDAIRKAIEPFQWYQTIDIHGVSTPGRFNHKNFLPHYHLPESLDGMSVLDVGCADGFFSFELEKRGARSVLGVDANRQDGTLEDLDYSPSLRADTLRKYQSGRDQTARPPREEASQAVGAERATTFHVAKALLGSRVEHELLSIYSLASLDRKFDVLFCGTLTEHLKNPLGAFEQLRAATGRLCIVAACGMIFPPSLSPTKRTLARLLETVARKGGLGPLLMLPNDTVCRYTGHQYHNSFFRCTVPATKAMLEASGFGRVDLMSTFVLTTAFGADDFASPHAVFHCHV